MSVDRNTGPEDSGTLGFSLLPFKQLAGYVRDMRSLRSPISGRVHQAFAYMVGVQGSQSAGEPIGQPTIVQVDSQGRIVTNQGAGSGVVQLADSIVPARLATVSAVGAVSVDGSAVTQPVSGNVGQATAPATTGGITAVGQTVTASNLSPYTGVQLQITGVYATGAALAAEISPDGGTTWLPIAISRSDNSLVGTGIGPAANASLAYECYIGGANAFRLRCSAWGAPAGTINVTINPYADGDDTWITATLANTSGQVMNSVGTTADAVGGAMVLGAASEGYTYNGATWDRLRSLGAAGDGLGVILAMPPSSAPATASAAGAATVAASIAAVAGQRNRLTMLSISITGSAALAAAVNVQILDGATVVWSTDLGTLGNYIFSLPAGGIRGSVNTALNINTGAPGAGNTIRVNYASLTA